VKLDLVNRYPLRFQSIEQRRMRVKSLRLFFQHFHERLEHRLSLGLIEQLALDSHGVINVRHRHSLVCQLQRAAHADGVEKVAFQARGHQAGFERLLPKCFDRETVGREFAATGERGRH
jgi:hypothetical protein